MSTIESWNRLQSTLLQLAPGLAQRGVPRHHLMSASAPPPPTSIEHQDILNLLPEGTVLRVISPRGTVLEVLNASRVGDTFEMLRGIDALSWPSSSVPFASQGRDLLVVNAKTGAVFEQQTDTGCAWPVAESLKDFFERQVEQLLAGEIAVVEMRVGSSVRLELTPWTKLAQAWKYLDIGDTTLRDGPAWERLSRRGNALFQAAVAKHLFSPPTGEIARATIQRFGLLAIAPPSLHDDFVLDLLDAFDADPALPDGTSVDKDALMTLASSSGSQPSSI